ncbi:hypothetical protein H206_05152 [Candidatus Electrothrix aarhusensis]|uniref:Uncharacterized protein n=1 Tax=Candidatus Electrothrix aarhusensis TaxID=1859131 RepID=A0A3S3QIF0_9BACT|nr:hypothetical protein H206_05152 [Candidatus Electrothrix aarhusensis]
MLCIISGRQMLPLQPLSPKHRNLRPPRMNRSLNLSLNLNRSRSRRT